MIMVFSGTVFLPLPALLRFIISQFPVPSCFVNYICGRMAGRPNPMLAESGLISMVYLRSNRRVPDLILLSLTNPIEAVLWTSFDEPRSLDFRCHSEKSMRDTFANINQIPSFASVTGWYFFPLTETDPRTGPRVRPVVNR